MLNLIHSILPKQSERLKTELINYGKRAGREECIRESQQIRDSEVYKFNGRFIIGVSNEYSDLIVGKASIINISTSNTPVVQCKDYVSGNELIIMGKTFFFTEQRLQTLLSLNPNERCSLVFNNYPGVWSMPAKTIMNPKEYNDALIESGFYIDYFLDLQLNPKQTYR